MNASKEQVDDLCKKVADLTELAQKKTEGYEETVRTLIKDVLSNHPGMTPDRKIQFADNTPRGEEAILDSMPAELQKEADDMFLISKILKTNPKSLKRWGGFERKLGDFKKALDTATTGQGQEWVPTGFTNQLYELVRLETKVAALFPQIIMPTNPYKLPIQIGRLQTYKHAEQTADSGQTTIPVSDVNSLTGNTVLTAVGHAAYVLCSKDIEEDSIVPILPFLRAEIITALAEGREDCIVNGDTSGTDDSDISSASDRRKMWTGLRRMANSNSYTADLSELSFTNFNNLLRAPMKKYGVNPANLAIITGIKGYCSMLNMREVTTVDKYGPSATILSGELGKLGGVPIVVSEWIREDLTAAGVYGSGQTKTVIHLVNRNSYAVGVRREASVQLLVEKYADSDQDALKTRERVVFSPIFATTEKTGYLGVNV